MRRVFPSSFSRDWQCPNNINDNGLADGSPGGGGGGDGGYGFEADSVPLSEASWTRRTRGGGRASDVQLCLILVKRVASNSSGTTLYNKRFCSGGGERLSFETWSGSKFLAMGNAAEKLPRSAPTAGGSDWTP